MTHSILFMASLLCLLPGCRPCAPASKLDETSIINASGDRISISSLFTEELTVLIFTDTTCPIANRFSPTIDSLQKEFPTVDFYLVFPDPNAEAETITQHLKDYSLPANYFRDPQHQLVIWTGATRTPEAVLYHKPEDGEPTQLYRGRINNRFVDFGVERKHITSHDLSNAIKDTLAGTPLSVSKTTAIGCQIPTLP